MSYQPQPFKPGEAPPTKSGLAWRGIWSMLCTYCRKRMGRPYPALGAVCPRCGEVVGGTTSVKHIQQNAETCGYATQTLAVWWGLLTNWRR